LFRKRRSKSEFGFTLIEALVALAIIATVLSSIASVIGVTVKGTRAIGQRLALTGAADTVLTSLPGRDALRPGRQSGELAGHRWRVDVSQLNTPGREDAPGSFVPMAVDLLVQSPGGPAVRVTTVRLVPRNGQ
jgi:general secretion pathway protein I